MTDGRELPRALHDSLRGQYLRDVLATLYPVGAEPGGTRLAEFVAVPNLRSPRLLVPAQGGRIAAAALRRYARPPSRIGRLKRELAAVALWTGASRFLLPDRVRLTGPADADTIDGYLRAALGRDLVLSVHIGPARANRKPVLQLLRPDGRTIGFAKLGTNPLTRRLVRLETTALATLSHLRLRRVVVPAVLHAGTWRGHEVLVQEALPTWVGSRPGGRLAARRLTEATVEVSRCLGVSGARLADSMYWKGLDDRLAGLDRDEAGEVLTVAARELTDRAGDVLLAFGTWHGDWAPWNLSVRGEGVLAWDWERFTPGAPLGFDALHHELHARLERGEPADSAVDACVARAEILLRPFEVAGSAARIVALLYLVDLATRYLTDRQAQAGARLGALGTWLLPVLVRRVTAL